MSVVAINERVRTTPHVGHLGALKYLSLGRTETGCVRQINEDAFVDRPEAGLWAVADGMGGHDAGEVASAAVANALEQVSAFRSAYGFRHAVCAALQTVNADLRARARDLAGSLCGSTVAALIVHQGHYACLWAGDSRAYLYRNGEIRRLTKDHSLVQNMIDAGTLSEAQAHRHPASHVITRAVGARDALELESTHGAVRAGDRFLLCTDGVSGLVSDGELAVCIRNPPLAASLDKMLALALSRGGPDNASAVLVAAELR